MGTVSSAAPAPRVCLAVLGDTFSCHDRGRWSCTAGTECVAARDTATRPATPRTFPTTKDHLAPDVSSAKVEKPCSRLCN